MKAHEWAVCQNPEAMLGYLRGKAVATDRKVRLFACACCRAVWGQIPEGVPRQTVEQSERIADGVATETDIAGRPATYQDWRSKFTARDDRRCALSAVYFSGDANVMSAAKTSLLSSVSAAHETLMNMRFDRDVLKRFSDILRDLIPSPLAKHKKRLATPVVLTSVKKLAEGIYEDCAFDRLPILADALEEAGCTDPEILNHCRQPGEHWRGCWVVDLVLGKE